MILHVTSILNCFNLELNICISQKNGWINPCKKSPPRATKARVPWLTQKVFHLQVSVIRENIFGRPIYVPTVSVHLCGHPEGWTLVWPTVVSLTSSWASQSQIGAILFWGVFKIVLGTPHNLNLTCFTCCITLGIYILTHTEIKS